MSGSKAQSEREKYVRAFNLTMIKIWREQIILLGAIDTGALYRSVVAVGMNADGKFTSVSLSQKFNLYGLYVDYGTGSNTPRVIRAILAKPTPESVSDGSAENILPRL